MAAKCGAGGELPLCKHEPSATMKIWTGVNNMKRLFVTPAGKSAIINTFDDAPPGFGYRTEADFIQNAAANSRLTPPGHFVLFYNQYVEHGSVIAPKEEWGPDTRFSPDVLTPGTTSLAADIDVIQGASLNEL